MDHSRASIGHFKFSYGMAVERQSSEKILDAPDIGDNYYLNILDWSSKNIGAIAFGDKI